MSFYPSDLTVFDLEDSSFKCMCLTMLVFILICAASLVVYLSFSGGHVVEHPSLSIKHQEYLVRKLIIRNIKLYCSISTSMT